MYEALVSQIEYLLSIGRADEAATLAAQGLQDDPNSPLLLVLMARAQLGLGNPAVAVEAARAALTMAPEATLALVVLADAYSQAGQTEQALAAADAAVQQEPHSGWAYYVRASARNQGVSRRQLFIGSPRAQAQMDLAEADAELAVELDSMNPSFHVLLGEILLRRQSDRAARRSFTAALEIDPTNSHALAGLAETDISELRTGDAQQKIADGLGVNAQSPELQRRSHQYLRLRVFLPLWVATLTPSIAIAVALWIGHRSPVTAAIVVVGTAASIGFVVWWWRQRLSQSERNRFLHGDGRRILVISSILWVSATLAGLVPLFSSPTRELWFPPADRPASESPPVHGSDIVGLLMMPLTGAGVAVVIVVWLFGKVMRGATGLGDRLRTRAAARER